MDRRARNQAKILAIKTFYGCRNCGEDELSCLTFHHLDPKKKNHTVCKNLARHSRKTISREISQTSVLCLNCHRKVEVGILYIGPEKLCKVDDNLKPYDD